MTVTARPAWTVVPFLARAAEARRRRRAGRDLPAVLDDVARGVRAGSGLPSSLASAAASAREPIAGDLQLVAAAVAQGVPVIEAIDAWAARDPIPGLALVAGAVAVSEAAGGSPAAALDGVAATLREHEHARAAARAYSTQARLSALVMAAAPVGFSVLAAVLDPGTASFLLGTAAGRTCLGTGSVLVALGALWMARITRIDA